LQDIRNDVFSHIPAMFAKMLFNKDDRILINKPARRV